MTKLEPEVQELKNVVGRSRSPRMLPRHKALPAPQQKFAFLAGKGGKEGKARQVPPSLVVEAVAAFQEEFITISSCWMAWFHAQAARNWSRQGWKERW